ncbi:MAG: selenium-binding protein SBP56-related protein, partial [Xanthomonadales bacterium]|nr:selenium-binding protein SBP56-related protein [Xanthomonadales bacterium]
MACALARALARAPAWALACALACSPVAAQDTADLPVTVPDQEAGALPGALPRSLILAWMKDNDAEHPAFLAVIDADPNSPGYGTLLTTTPAGEALQDAHHTHHSLPTNGRLFANAFRDGKTYIFDTRIPQLPVLAGAFERLEGYSYPHSFVELDNGNVLVTFQTSGENADQAGGLVELTPEGDVVRASSAADSSVGFVRPYSLEVF